MSATTITLTAKHGKNKISLPSLPPTATIGSIKQLLQQQTNILPIRQKLIGLKSSSGSPVTDTTTLAELKLKKDNECSCILMGTPEEAIAAVDKGGSEKVVFLEDLPEEERAKVVEPSGLINLGNTCYLNSVVQALRVVPALRRGLLRYKEANSGRSGGQNGFLMGSLLETLATLDSSPQAISPNNLVMATKMSFPQMAQTGPGGRPMQQDAEEFYSQILNVASQELLEPSLRAAFSSTDNFMGATNLIDALFGLQMEQRLTCDEVVLDTASSDDDSPTTTDLARKLVCNIQSSGNNNSEEASNTNITHIAEGISLSLSDKVEKYSDTLGRNAMHTRTQRISRLPSIIVVQFGRFYWKSTPDSQDHTGVKCKVMKPVGFASILDVYEFCTDKVKSVLKVGRDKAAKVEEERVAKKLRGEEVDDEKQEDVTMMEEEEDEELKAALAMSVAKEVEPVGVGLPPDFQGLYELFAVVTHKGRDADGGHYMSWVKASNNAAGGGSEKRQKIADNAEEENEDWYVFDDDEVSPCKTEDILKLKGGGDWHMSYLNFYRAKK